ncbi:MAG: hypothetical protein COW32_04815 [Candidatus Aquicultor secundus]|uniref:Uncharacterized protein n=1 Tax=Candidatus Aquicultor secundus TaxID=1973895 RepID=A0A2M7TA38_9ACTN|nr:hypothetical protein [Candidatus Aquicultor secundus]NCO66091.1 hypothetical protein [Solirubrobacter sp.]OIO87710.1 MAG: hypothetical protein AUK32_03200 [Candidatus Aquicultor secundus]PIU27903.1 MAG: hypothetical protein COT10_01105 [Candidatus Aquicultor secundus]PIW22412.1 MAG: hypothetical protein COW32_04815 [Candidatus Aquicultor secundus]PIX53018.1 MAG: hypothetical protein COZ51_00965 [Candidatus Aquicultor secundus]
MIKININLLPREIQDKRSGEKMIIFALLALVGFAGILGAIYAFNSWQIKMSEDRLAMLQNQTARMNTTIDGLRVYEHRLQEIQRRKQVMEKAVAGQIFWSKVLEEIMIATPNDVSLASLNGTADGITFDGSIMDPEDNPDQGHKPVAKWLLRLADMKPQPDVWLSSATKDETKHTIHFANTIKFKELPTLPAPPTTSGK